MIRRRTVLSCIAGAALMLGVAGATIAQDKTELSFSAVFSQQDIRAEMMEKFKEAVAEMQLY